MPTIVEMTEEDRPTTTATTTSPTLAPKTPPSNVNIDKEHSSHPPDVVSSPNIKTTAWAPSSDDDMRIDDEVSFKKRLPSEAGDKKADDDASKKQPDVVLVELTDEMVTKSDEVKDSSSSSSNQEANQEADQERCHHESTETPASTTSSSSSQHEINNVKEKGHQVEVKKDESQISEEELNKYPRINAKFLREHCKKNKLYLTPELNDVLYLHYKGFMKIENLEKYTGLRALYLECNGLNRIENLDNQTELRCLFVQQNLLDSIGGLDATLILDTLNVSNNRISKIENIAHLAKLNTLQISHNRLSTAEDLAELETCDYLSVLDMSHNRMDDPNCVDVLAKMKNLRVLNMMGNPVIKKIKNYRKTMVLRLTHLTFLDDRPVFPRERATTEAWAKGGREAEKAERERWINKERAKIQASVDALWDVRKRAEASRKDKQEREAAGKSEAEETISPAVTPRSPDDEDQFTFSVEKGIQDESAEEPSSGKLIEDMVSDCVAGSDPTTSSGSHLTTELDEEDSIETIELGTQEKIDIDDLPDLEDIDVSEDIGDGFAWATPTSSNKKASRPLIEEISSSPSPSTSSASKPGITEIPTITKKKDDAKSPSARPGSKLLIEDLTETTSQSAPEKPAFITEIDQSEVVGPSAQTAGNRLLIEDVTEADAQVQQAEGGPPDEERNAAFDFVRESGGRVPRSWEIMEERKKQEQACRAEEDGRKLVEELPAAKGPETTSDKAVDEQQAEKIWDLAANAGSTVNRSKESYLVDNYQAIRNKYQHGGSGQ